MCGYLRDLSDDVPPVRSSCLINCSLCKVLRPQNFLRRKEDWDMCQSVMSTRVIACCAGHDVTSVPMRTISGRRRSSALDDLHFIKFHKCLGKCTLHIIDALAMCVHPDTHCASHFDLGLFPRKSQEVSGSLTLVEQKSGTARQRERGVARTMVEQRISRRCREWGLAHSEGPDRPERLMRHERPTHPNAVTERKERRRA